MTPGTDMEMITLETEQVTSGTMSGSVNPGDCKYMTLGTGVILETADV